MTIHSLRRYRPIATGARHRGLYVGREQGVVEVVRRLGVFLRFGAIPLEADADGGAIAAWIALPFTRKPATVASTIFEGHSAASGTGNCSCFLSKYRSRAGFLTGRREDNHGVAYERRSKQPGKNNIVTVVVAKVITRRSCFLLLMCFCPDRITRPGCVPIGGDACSIYGLAWSIVCAACEA